MEKYTNLDKAELREVIKRDLDLSFMSNAELAIQVEFAQELYRTCKDLLKERMVSEMKDQIELVG